MQSKSSKLAEHAWKECHDGRYDSAIEAYREALNLDPLNQTALRGLGWSYYHKGNYDDAIHYFDSTLERKQVIPKSTLQDVFRGIGWSYYRKGEFNKGINSFQKAIENIDSDSDGVLTDARRGLNLCRQVEGDNGLIGHRFYEALEQNNITLKTPITKLGSPEFIEIEPINKCNLQCIMCHVTYEKGKRSIVDPSFVKRLKGLEGSWVTMGATYEPVLHPNFKDIVLELSSMGIKIDLITNGTLLTKEMSDSLADANFRNVTFSFDGMRKETYESIRKNANYEKTLERILYFKNAIKRKETYFAVNYTVLKRNVEEIPEAVEFWDKHGFQHIGFIAMVVRNLTKDLLHESPESIMDRVREKMEESGRLIIEKSLKITISSPIFSSPTELKRAYPKNFVDNVVKSDNREASVPFNPRTLILNGAYPGMSVNCRVPFKYARIMFNGDVEMCYQFTIGNIHQDDFMDIWQGETAQKLREKIISTPKICYACDYFRLCVKGGEVDYSESDSFISERIKSKYRYPTILEEGKSHNIVAWLGDYYAVPRWMREPDMWMFEGTDESKGVFVAPSLSELKILIEKDFLKYGFRRPTTLEDFGLYRIVGFRNKYYGVNRLIHNANDSALELHRFMKLSDVLRVCWNLIRFYDLFTGKSVNEVKILIEKDFQKYGYRRPAILENYGPYFIVGYQKNYYGVRKPMRKILSIPSLLWVASVFRNVFVAQSVNELKSEITKHEPSSSSFIKTYNSYNLVCHNKIYYGLPDSIDPSFLPSMDAHVFCDVVKGKTTEEVEKKINALLATGGADKRTKKNIDNWYDRPTFLENFEDYIIIGYQCWYYGIHKSFKKYHLVLVVMQLLRIIKLSSAVKGKTIVEIKRRIISSQD